MNRFAKRLGLGMVLVALPVALTFVSYKVAETSIASTTVLAPLSPDTFREEPPHTPSPATPSPHHPSPSPHVTEEPTTPSGNGSGGGNGPGPTSSPTHHGDSGGGNGEPGHTGGDD